ncbi:tRNA uridine-5-carboxymethylaminomethyl(34) synthesis GTPase MnmE [Pigmentibacter ruber]|uniref:tRNA uridine-5-carboxymethylaminomethyl(34) synthesis GTPase MnmE n=1 Tax=Pigmentibacter ruber TaxID=2683196 RepID=UPI00131A9F0E|nr:tRNA uridine-5-carboxymethylaminomethyl(34) synthesis GTPase MnmE [Pigmentibacter ruber]
MTSSNDPIFALSSANARSAIHIHRISGINLLPYFQGYLFKIKSNEVLNVSMIQEQISSKPYLQYLYIKDAEGNILDDVLFTFFKAPKSYTGEDIIEISSHGNPLISSLLQRLFRHLGLRDALPGEFTQRAYLNGKIDLVQAEGINQLIHAETMGGIQLARDSVAGELSKETEEVKNVLIEIMAYLEAHIDFAPDEVGDYQPESLMPLMKQALAKLQNLLNSYSSGLRAREGVKIALVGKPNAGKSSLYNALLKFERAIVTHIPGTTRDILEDRLIIRNKDFVLIDTAGIRETEDTVEKIGVERSIKTLSKADVICLIISLENVYIKNIKKFLEETLVQFLLHSDFSPEQIILPVFSKMDLMPKEIFENILNFYSEVINDKKFLHLENILSKKCIFCSHNDTESLSSQLVKLHDQLTGLLGHKNNPTLISERQRNKIEIAVKNLKEGIDLIYKKDYPEKISSVINQGRQSLQEVVGEIQLDQVLEKIFSTFCIGK